MDKLELLMTSNCMGFGSQCLSAGKYNRQQTKHWALHCEHMQSLTETLEARTPSNFGILWHCSSNNIIASTHMLYTLLPQSYRQQHIFVITLIVNVNTMFHSCLHWNICRLHQPNLQKFQHKYQSLILQLKAIQDRLTWFTVAVQRGGFIRSQLAALNCHLPLMVKATM